MSKKKTITIDLNKEMTVKQYALQEKTTPAHVYVMIKRRDILTKVIPELDDLLLVLVDTLSPSIIEKRKKKILSLLHYLDEEELKKLKKGSK